jgi:glycosyltransferase involved in cell wall biosynthesis
LITLVLTYRNRDLGIVENCLNSLREQSIKSFKVFLVDYGSDLNYANGIKKMVANYDFIQLIECPVSGQLWNKCRAINIALKQTKTEYFLVGDIDLIFHPNFIKVASKVESNKILYFKYGFLSEKESLFKKRFKDYEVDFTGGEEVTGTTLFPTDKLMEVNGYDEFYHGWGAEDTDIHIRLKEIGLTIEFYNKEILVKHQWHPKAYRSKFSTSPFHSNLERVNNKYMSLTAKQRRTLVNLNFDWGKLPKKKEYELLKRKSNHSIKIKTIDFEISSLLAQFRNFRNEVVNIEIIEGSASNKNKQYLKRILNKKHLVFLDIEIVNNLILEEIIKNYRNQPYIYTFDRSKGFIKLTILF